MPATTSDTADLGAFYEIMTSTEGIMRRLERDGVDVANLRASDLSERDLDCQNLGALKVLTWIADTVARRSAPTPDDAVLDVGCGIGGPGRFLVERFGCAVTGVDLLQARIDVAAELTHPHVGAHINSSGTGTPISQPATSTGLRPKRSDRVPAKKLVAALTMPKAAMNVSVAVTAAIPNSSLRGERPEPGQQPLHELVLVVDTQQRVRRPFAPECRGALGAAGRRGVSLMTASRRFPAISDRAPRSSPRFDRARWRDRATLRGTLIPGRRGEQRRDDGPVGISTASHAKSSQRPTSPEVPHRRR